MPKSRHRKKPGRTPQKPPAYTFNPARLPQLFDDDGLEFVKHLFDAIQTGRLVPQTHRVGDWLAMVDEAAWQRLEHIVGREANPGGHQFGPGDEELLLLTRYLHYLENGNQALTAAKLARLMAELARLVVLEKLARLGLATWPGTLRFGMDLKQVILAEELRNGPGPGFRPPGLAAR